MTKIMTTTTTTTTTTTMTKLSTIFLLTVSVFLAGHKPFSVVASEDIVDTTAGSCTATSDAHGEDGTCNNNPPEGANDDPNNDTKDNEGRLCFPDGSCFDSMQEADVHYKTQTHHVPLSTPVIYGEPQQVAGPDWYKSMQIVQSTNTYMTEQFQNDTAKPYRDECKCRHELCAFWAAIGECEKNPPYMLLHCAPVCQTCHEISFEHRCPYDPEAPTIWSPGDLNTMFERLTTDPYYVERFEPTVLSRDPWIVTLENVATKEECERMIQLGADRGYERSQDVGKKNWDGTYQSVKQTSRTSANTWCVEDCWKDELNQGVLRRVENITGIPDANSEYWQFLKYEEGQYYRAHHDYIEFHNERAQGVRILTVFLYLSDVEEGGGTRFNSQKITVQPKQGRAVIWPSVLDEDPNKKDSRTGHEALPVIKGVKYAANAWVHQRDFKKPFSDNCS